MNEDDLRMFRGREKIAEWTYGACAGASGAGTGTGVGLEMGAVVDGVDEAGCHKWKGKIAYILTWNWNIMLNLTIRMNMKYTWADEAPAEPKDLLCKKNQRIEKYTST